MATKSDTFETTPAQDLAIAALVRGASVNEAAQESNVSRQTVSTWKNQDPAFIAALNQARQDARDQDYERIRKVRGKALAKLEQALEESSNIPLALEVLKVTAKMDSTPIGPTDAQRIADDQFLAKLSREFSA